MASPITTANNVEVQTTFILRRFLEQLGPRLQFAKLSTPGDVPEGAGNEVRWLHFEEIDFTGKTDALSETDGSDHQLANGVSITSVSGTMADYGFWDKLSERQRRTMVAGAYDQIASRFAEGGAILLDDKLYEAAKGSTNYFMAGNTDANTGFISSTSTLSASDYNYQRAWLESQKNVPFDMLGGEFASVIHPTQAAQIRGETKTTAGKPTWHDLNQRNNQGEPVMRGDNGSLYGIALFESQVIDAVASVSVSGTDGASETVSGYVGITLAKDGLGHVDLDDAEPEVMVKVPGDQDTSQPLNRYSTIGVQFGGAFKLLSSKRVLVLYSYKA